jgi:NMD protein affecting ribosome stability and mRNA decay
VVAVFECVVCGEHFEDTTHGACHECYEKIKKKVMKFLNGFTEAEYEVVMGIINEL